MTRTVVAGAFAWMLTLASTGSAEPLLFDGQITVTRVANCAFVQAGWRNESVYRVAGSGGLPDYSAITQLFSDGAVGYRLTSGRFAESFSRVTGRAVSGDGSQRDFAARLRIVNSSPRTTLIDAETTFIALAGEIETPFGDRGAAGERCVVRFNAAYTRRVAE